MARPTDPTEPSTERSTPLSPFVPETEDIGLYQRLFGFLTPYEYDGWRAEQRAYKETCYLNGTLNPTTTVRIWGPEAEQFLTDFFVNNFEYLGPGRATHGIMCNEEGEIMRDGVVLRTEGNEFYTYWVSPYVDYLLQAHDYDAEFEVLTGSVFLFQVGGPTSLQTLEAATGENLHDLGHFHHRETEIDGRPVRVLRLGMAGTLSYEVHGRIEDARPVFAAIHEAGEAFGVERLGSRTYFIHHTETGYPQASIHFWYPWETDPAFVEYAKEAGMWLEYAGRGSFEEPSAVATRNPVELGWGNLIDFDHEFPGKEALQELVEAPDRTTVTLVWNPEDVAAVHASQFGDEEPYEPIEGPYQTYFEDGAFVFKQDKVTDSDGTVVGISSGRFYSEYYQQMLSLCQIDREASELGTEVTVIHGEPDARQKAIRATVARYPYLDLERNYEYDVSQIPTP